MYEAGFLMQKNHGMRLSARARSGAQALIEDSAQHVYAAVMPPVPGKLPAPFFACGRG